MLLQYQFTSLFLHKLCFLGDFFYFRMGNGFLVLKIYLTVAENVETLNTLLTRYISTATAKTVTNVVQVKGTCPARWIWPKSI
jgi:hypothetical protein